MSGHVRKRGSKWYYSFEASEVDGKRKRIERVGGRTKKEAESALRKALEEYENAGLHFETSNISVSDYMDYWFEEYVKMNCKYNTQLAYKQIVNNHIKKSLGVYKLKSLTPAVLQKFINKKYEEGLSKNYLSNIMGVLSGSIKYAVFPCGFIKDNLMQYIKLPKMDHEKNRKKSISQEEFKVIIDRFDKNTSFYVPLQIGYNTGMRIGEVTGLTWNNIDLENKTINIERIIGKQDYNQWYFGTPKTVSSVRVIKIGNTLINILKQHRKNQIESRLKYGQYYMSYYEEDTRRIYSVDNTLDYITKDQQVSFVCTAENGSLITPDSFKYCSRVINHELDIDFNYHALRHTHATLLIENGANIKDVQKRLGHARIATTMDIYAHVTKKMEEDTVAIFEELVDDLPTM